MPVSVNRSPFASAPSPAVPPLRTPQVRVLAALVPDDPGTAPINRPLITRAMLRVACKMAPTNSMNRVLHGVKVGTGKHPGLIELGLVEIVTLDVEGVTEFNYRITTKGIQCLSHRSADPK